MNSNYSRLLSNLYLGIILMTMVLLVSVGMSLAQSKQVQAAEDLEYVSLATSNDDTNRYKHFELKDYALNMFKRPGFPYGYDPSSVDCIPSPGRASVPWLPSTGAAGNMNDLGYTAGGSYLYETGDCKNRYSDGGTDGHGWLSPLWNAWTSVAPGDPGKNFPGFNSGQVPTGDPSTVASSQCNTLPGGNGSSTRFIFGKKSADYKDQAYGPGGIFFERFGAKIQSNRVTLISAGTTLIRNQFFINDATYDRLQSGGLHVYAVADDWVSIYINGHSLISTVKPAVLISDKTAGVISASDFINRGWNVISMQVHDKAHWWYSPGVTPPISAAGVCYRLTAEFPKGKFDLHPNITSDSGLEIEPGQSIKVDPSISHDPSSKVPGKDTAWELNRLVYRSGVSVPHTGETTSTKSPTDQFAVTPPGGRLSSDLIKKGDEAVVPYPFGTILTDPSFTVNTDDLEPGATVCFVLSIRPYSSDSPADRWRHSRPVCSVVVKKPAFQAWGSDVRVGGSAVGTGRFGIDSNTKYSSGADARAFGSWGEYGVFASNPVIGFASGATLKRGLSGTATPSQAQISKLTFANTPAGTNGSFAGAGGIGPIPRQEIKDHAAFSSTGGGVPSGTINNTQIYRTAGNVTINSNIEYSSTANSAGSMPQVVIIADNIYINPTVKRIDAWLIADNVIDTCSPSSGFSLTTNTINDTRCNRELTINGPVMAKTLKLKRTYVSTSSRAEPAEVINLRSDAYIWAHNRYNQSGTSMRTSYISELPPRF